MTTTKESTKVRPAPAGSCCCFQVGLRPSGHPTHCPVKAVIKINDHCYCQHHAELVMVQVSGRDVRIQRGGVVVDSKRKNKRAIA